MTKGGCDFWKVTNFSDWTTRKSEKKTNCGYGWRRNEEYNSDLIHLSFKDIV